MKRVCREGMVLFGLLIVVILIFNTIFFEPIRLPWDAYYHLSRIENLSKSWFAFLYPQNFTSLGQYGLATNIFYPGLTLQLIQNLILHVDSAILAFKISMVLTTWLSGLSVYVVIRKYSIFSRMIAFCISVLWLTTIGVTALSPGNLAESTAYIGIPWLVCGLYLVTRQSDSNIWNSVTYIIFGLSISAYSHVMTFLILSILTAVFFICLVIIDGNKLRIIKIAILGGIGTSISTLAVVIPIMIIQISNRVTKPVVNHDVFANNVKDIGMLLLDPSSNPDIWLPLLFIVTVIIFGYKKPTVGIILGLIFMLLGTNIFPWTYYLKDTPISTIQFATRLVKPGIAVALMFSFFNLSINDLTNHNRIKYKKGFVIFTLIVGLIMMGTIRNNWFPNHNSKEWSEQQIKKYTEFHDAQHDGYGYSMDMTFTDKISNSPDFWYLKNYTDYIPESALSHTDKMSTFIGSDIEGLLLTKHQIIDSNGKTYNTRDYQAGLKSVTMRNNAPILSKSIIELPIVAYKMLNLEVTINGKTQKYFIRDGKIALKLSETLHGNSVVSVKQKIPLWIIICNIISLTFLMSLFIFQTKLFN
ncbi:hypothetical protein [Leuconostoc pseudomesenteroides]|uniref:hypothetical protein n=1 Tax=Leuconostoc pseudomesenteroides TaxID=33968 RepID=UPI002286CDB7|nr:hypothetical protein [Leuconostoc pseudomesenteroides]WAM37944.1 hypothetical protein OYT93_06970 [Leuconostoc pseudomesenteroides]